MGKPIVLYGSSLQPAVELDGLDRAVVAFNVPVDSNVDTSMGLEDEVVHGARSWEVFMEGVKLEWMVDIFTSVSLDLILVEPRLSPSLNPSIQHPVVGKQTQTPSSHEE